jgi:UDP-N-acetyl-D-glucosamine dehydrogenase
VIGLLQKKGAIVEYHDPCIPHLRTHDDIAMESVKDLMEAVRRADCTIIITNHSSYDYKAILKEANFIFDSRNALGKQGKNNPKVVRL